MANKKFFIIYTVLFFIFLFTFSIWAGTNTIYEYSACYETGGYTGGGDIFNACQTYTIVGQGSPAYMAHGYYCSIAPGDFSMPCLNLNLPESQLAYYHTEYCSTLGCDDVVGYCVKGEYESSLCRVDPNGRSCYWVNDSHTYHAYAYVEFLASGGSEPVMKQNKTIYTQTYDCASCFQGSLVNNSISEIACTQNTTYGTTDVGSCYDANSDGKIDHLYVNGGNINTVASCPKRDSQLEINSDGPGCPK